MSDVADKAQYIIDLQLQSDINQALNQSTLPQKIGATGSHICIDCDAVIPEARIAAAPKAVRCIGCQRDLEGWK
ncbi:MAG: TraR/DksA C4-type zinc finger protein [Ghiorsea sp.]|nr:TraR/DksA C4-type zinc finger protein [Ghiorsea sp.]